MRNLGWILFFVSTVSFGSPLIEDNPVVPAVKAEDNPVVPAVKALEALAEFDLSCASDDQCEAVAYGHRACGGPNGYVVASSENIYFPQIEDLAAASTVAEEEWNRKNGIFSICILATEPTIKCENRRCMIDSEAEYF